MTVCLPLVWTKGIMKTTVFIDRDGTINRDVGYLTHPNQLELIPRAAAAISNLNRAGLLVVVVSNQAGIAKGFIQEKQVPAIHEVFLEILSQEGARIDGFYYCPHHPQGLVKKYTCSCICRKPAPGLLLRASEEMHIDLARSYVVGDKVSDMQLAHNVGATAVMVLTGHGRRHQSNYPADCHRPHYTCNDLYDAVQWILKNNKEQKEE
jgi:D-glycero-D-manno-heptose 1,7-bisphosphate phosphatase